MASPRGDAGRRVRAQARAHLHAAGCEEDDRQHDFEACQPSAGAALRGRAHRAFGDVEPDQRGSASDRCTCACRSRPGSASSERQHLERQRAAAGRREPELPGEAEHDQRERGADRRRARTTRSRARLKRRDVDPSLLMMPAMHRDARPVTEPPRSGALARAALQAWPWLDDAANTLVRALPRRPPRPDREQPHLHDASSRWCRWSTVMLAVFTAFPMFATLQAALQKYFLQTLVPDNIAKPVLGAITHVRDPRQPPRHRRPDRAASSPRWR